MAAPVASLSSDGWIADIARKTDRLLSYFFVSQQSQSNSYRGRIASLPALIQQYGSNPLELKTNMRLTLIRLLSPYYDSVDVNVDVETENTQTAGRMDVTVTITLSQNGQTYQAANLLQLLNSKLVKIINLNNYG